MKICKIIPTQSKTPTACFYFFAVLGKKTILFFGEHSLFSKFFVDFAKILSDETGLFGKQT